MVQINKLVELDKELDNIAEQWIVGIKRNTEASTERLEFPEQLEQIDMKIKYI